MPEGYVTTRCIGKMQLGDKGLIDFYDLDVDEGAEVWIPYYERYDTGEPTYRDQAWVEMTEAGLVVTIRSRPAEILMSRPIHPETIRQGLVPVAEIRVDIDNTFGEADY